VQLLGVDPAKVLVTYQALPKQRPADRALATSLLKNLRIEPGKFVLFAGNIEPKKNLMPLIQAVAGMHGVRLVAVGAKAWLWEKPLEEARRLLKTRFVHLDYVSREELTALMATAGCFAFPSLYEGFGLPPLEAMAQGCPVVVSNSSSLPEVCGDAALYAEPLDVIELRTQIQRCLEDEAIRAALHNAAQERLKFFSPQRYAERLSAAYAEVWAS
jgi:glycosyltransferase involved in cell wall biosynthesis